MGSVVLIALALGAASGSLMILSSVFTIRKILRAVRMALMGAVGVTKAVWGETSSVECQPRTCSRQQATLVLLSGHNKIGCTHDEIVHDLPEGSDRESFDLLLVLLWPDQVDESMSKEDERRGVEVTEVEPARNSRRQRMVELHNAEEKRTNQ
jgi:hypothetical protein